MKKLLLSLFVSFVGLISFCSAGFSKHISVNVGVSANGGELQFPYYGKNCFAITNWNCSTHNVVYDSDGSVIMENGVYTDNGRGYTFPDDIICFNGTGIYKNTYTSNCTLHVWEFSSSCPVCPECPTCDPQYTSEECQSEYGLVSSGLLNICENNYNNCQSGLNSCQTSLSGRNNTLNNCSNNLLSCESSLASCIQSNCPIDTGDVMWSSLWINGIQHLGKPVINVSIPDNIYWDYTTNDESFDLYVGSGYDQDYIDGVIAINSYSPTSEDFTSVFVSGLTLIMPYIIFALFIVFLWKLIKRIFK